MLFWAAYYLHAILGYAHGTQIGEPDFAHIAPYFFTMVAKDGHFVGVLLDGAGIEVIPVGVASHDSQGALLTASADEQRDGRLWLWLTIGVGDGVVLAPE